MRTCFLKTWTLFYLTSKPQCERHVPRNQKVEKSELRGLDLFPE